MLCFWGSPQTYLLTFGVLEAKGTVSITYFWRQDFVSGVSMGDYGVLVPKRNKLVWHAQHKWKPCRKTPPDLLGGGNSNIFGIFTQKLGEKNIQFDKHNIFQMGWNFETTN